jgi:hypothetical protein
MSLVMGPQTRPLKEKILPYILVYDQSKFVLSTKRTSNHRFQDNYLETIRVLVSPHSGVYITLFLNGQQIPYNGETFRVN